MTLHSMGIGYKHDRNFRISRPNGSGDNLLLIFKTPAFITVNGTEITVVKDTAVLYSKKRRNSTVRLTANMKIIGFILTVMKMIYSLIDQAQYLTVPHRSFQFRQQKICWKCCV